MRIHVSALNQYSFCPRALYLSEVLKIKPQPSLKRDLGIVGHAIRKELSLRQANLLGKVKTPDEVQIALLRELENILRDIPYIYKEKLPLTTHKIISEIRPQILKEINLMNERLVAMIEEFGLEESLKKLTPWRVEFSLKSDKLLFSGRIDKVMKEEGTYIPIEIKTGEPADNVWEGDKLQTCAYAMLLEEKFKLTEKIKFGWVEYTKIQEKRPVMTTEQLRRKVLYTRDEIIEILKGKKIPEICPHGNEKKCQSCAFKEKCYEI